MMENVPRKELLALQKKFLLSSLFVVIALFVSVLFVGVYYNAELHNGSQWLYREFGFWPMCLVVYVSDVFLSPFPPDLFLIVIANSDLKTDWLIYLTMLSLASTLAGFTGCFLGRFLHKLPWLPSFMRKLPEKNKELVEKFGAWAVAIGALTPFPFSLTCWSAGFLRMPIRTFAIGAFMRFPRIFIYYWAIESALWVPSTIPSIP